MIISLLLSLLAAAPEAPREPPPLSPEQLAQVRALVQRTQAEQQTLKAELATSQEKLTRCYAEYKLDEPQVEKLQDEIVDLQKKLLASHHRLQKELRTIVGAERFMILSRRIENALRSPPPATNSKSSDKPEPKQ
ncbi:hypothetical protein NA78x_000774 [Anatilimnocola sp. NA78]|uniref:hypothetical protein n=1 Tax=Anatilimnocola sp. NA78 TaxID=3415683 RepID=UPI003CE51E78